MHAHTRAYRIEDSSGRDNGVAVVMNICMQIWNRSDQKVSQKIFDKQQQYVICIIFDTCSGIPANGGGRAGARARGGHQ